MRNKILVIVIMFSAGLTFAACPSADLTGDCRVDFNDFAVMSAQWLDELAPDPCGMVWVYINDDGSGMKDEYGDPIDKGGFNGYMSKYETTNAQYCEFLNAALASGDIYVDSNIVYGSNGSNSGADFVDEIYFDTFAAEDYSQIDYNDVSSSFSVRIRDSNDMSNHPVVMVSWYGATAFCNYYGYRLPTEWEWQAVADFDGSYTYGCGTTINTSKANCYYFSYANPLNLSSKPYTSPVDHYSSYGYGMNDMAGNVWEWTDSCYFAGCDHDARAIRGGDWGRYDYNRCTVSYRGAGDPTITLNYVGFRVCR
jgi:formylglycine-generating enzyme required for sulfatase activity